MPPRKSTTAAARRSSGRQNTLNFSAQPAKVTKPTGKSSSLAKAAETKASKLISEATPSASPTSKEVSLEPESPVHEQAPTKQSLDPEVGPTTAELAIRQQVEEEKIEHTEEEKRALNISDAQVKRYWKEKEDSRISPRVHQQGLKVEDKVLREFDLSSHFGPCIGIARTKRWKRAHKLGLNPPIEVLAVLMKHDAKSSTGVQRAYVDELMNGRTLET